jgi:hypothetical protein
MTLDVPTEPEARLRRSGNWELHRLPERNRIMKRVWLVFSLVVLLVAGLAVPAAAGGSSPPRSTWHRLNPDQSNPAPEHERLRCREAAVWVCRYDKVPEPALNFSWDRTTAVFRGRDITDRWACPDWFTHCAGVTRVVKGVSRIRPEGEPPFRVPLELVFLGDKVLYLLVPDALACPWFSRFRAALAANPFPLPFNGVDWPEQDCIFAPAA